MLVDAARRALQRSPWLANVAAGSTVLLLGDCAAQILAARRDRNFDWTLDKTRLGVVVLWSAMFDVPINVANFKLWESVFAKWGVASNASLRFSALKAVCFFTAGSLVRNPIYVGFVESFEHLGANVREGRALFDGAAECRATVARKLRDTLTRIFLDSAVLWIPLNTLSFWVLRPEFRPLATSVATVAWYAHLSTIQHGGDSQETVATAAAGATAMAAAAACQRAEDGK
jgi:hypothetical protein